MLFSSKHRRDLLHGYHGCCGWLGMLVLVIAMTGCGQHTGRSAVDDAGQNTMLRVTATTGMLGDAVERITGGEADVTTLMGPGVDPHGYIASQGDLQSLRRADAIVYNGLHLEGKMQEIMEQLAERRPVFPMAEGLDSTRLLPYGEEDNGLHDPHIWFDTELWSQGILRLAENLGGLVPERAQVWEANARAYVEELIQLRAQCRADLALVPESQRVLITSHDAFRYFGIAFDCEVRGLQGVSTMTEFGLRDRADLVDFIVERGISAVFVESSVSPKAIEAVVEGCRARRHEVSIGGELFSDAMGEKGTPEGTYVGMLEHNCRMISQALLGDDYSPEDEAAAIDAEDTAL